MITGSICKIFEEFGRGDATTSLKLPKPSSNRVLRKLI